MIQKLNHFPVTLFSVVMGVVGVGLAWRRASLVWGLPLWPFQVFFWIGLVTFVVLLVLYGLKWVAHPASARAEIAHPVRMTFVPTITTSLILLAVAAQDLMPTFATIAWWVGAVGQLLMTVLVMSAWSRRRDIGLEQLTPAWLIPVVGNIVTPLGAERIGSPELAWFSFGIGMVFWVGLLPLLLHRVLLHDPGLPTKLLPSLAIFAAPPAVGSLSWQALGGKADDPFSRILFGGAIMFVVLLVAQLPSLRTVPFSVPYWAYTFPLAATSTAALTMAQANQSVVYDVLAGLLLGTVTLLVLVIGALTLRAAGKGHLLRPE